MVSPVIQFIGDVKEVYLSDDNEETREHIIDFLKAAFKLLPKDKQLEIMTDLEQVAREVRYSSRISVVKGCKFDGKTLDEILAETRELVLWGLMEKIAETNDPALTEAYKRRGI